MHTLFPTQRDFNELHVLQQRFIQAEAALDSNDDLLFYQAWNQIHTLDVAGRLEALSANPFIRLIWERVLILDGRALSKINADLAAFKQLCSRAELADTHRVLQKTLEKMRSLNLPKKLSYFNETTGELSSEIGKVLQAVASKAELTQAIKATSVDPLQGAASICFAGEAFKEGQEIRFTELDFLIEKNFLVEKEVPIHRYFRSEIGDGFDFQDNGFEFVSFDQKLTEDLGSFADMPPSDDHAPLEDIICEEFRLFLTDWGRKQGIEFDIVIPLSRLSYRHTDTQLRYENQQRGNKLFIDESLKLAHIDYEGKNFSDLLLRRRWPPSWYAEGQLGLMDRSARLEDFEVSEVVNLWAPLNKHPPRNTLAVMDISTIRDPSEELKFFQASLTGLYSISSRPYHRWVVKHMQRGDGVVFKSFKTPHVAVTFAEAMEYEAFRHSLERRYLFCIDKRKRKG